MKGFNSVLRVTAVAAAIANSFILAPCAEADSESPKVSFALQTLKEENVEGPDVERTYFTVGADKISVAPPNGCQMRVEDDSLVLILSGLNLDGEIKITQSPFSPGFELTRNALKYRDDGAAALPRGAEQIQVEQPVLNPYPFNGWKSLGFTWNYAFRGRPMLRSVAYMNLEVGAQVVVTTLASKADASKVEAIAKQFIGSWWVMGRRKG
jgi:hypothetical protein